jgi:1-acyl-sn-glycerol-3-phosphate acyltransferase
MAKAWRWVRSFVFVVQMYAAMLVIGLLYLPGAIMSPEGARRGCKAYCRWVFWTASWMVGLRCEVRGTPPASGALVAAKHQSFLDILLIFNALPAAIFIMKREILWTPIIGLYAYRLGCVPVNRGKRGVAIKKMLADVSSGHQAAGQLIIYSQGTRVAPGVKAPYKIGTGALYEQMAQDCAPVATNVGVFWPRTGIYRKPGLAVVEFLPIIPPGLERSVFMEQLEEAVETASDRLIDEARNSLEARAHGVS